MHATYLQPQTFDPFVRGNRKVEKEQKNFTKTKQIFVIQCMSFYSTYQNYLIQLTDSLVFS